MPAPTEFIRKAISIVENGEADNISDAIDIAMHYHQDLYYETAKYYQSRRTLERVANRKLFIALSLELEELVQATIKLIDSTTEFDTDEILKILSEEVNLRTLQNKVTKTSNRT